MSIRNSAIAVIIKDKQLLALKCVDGEKTFYKLPGGGQRNGETLIEALKRECLEEISAEVEASDIIYIMEKFGGRHGPDWHEINLFFSCKLVDGTECRPGVEPDAAQVGIEWLPVEQLDRVCLLPKALVPLLMNEQGHDAPVYQGDASG